MNDLAGCKEYDTRKSLGAMSREFLGVQNGLPDICYSKWRLIMTQQEIARVVRSVADQLNKRFRDEQVVFTAILKGAYIFLTDLTRQLTFPYTVYFLEATSYGDEQVQADSVKLLSKFVPDKFHGRKVILIDELFDNGKTMHQMVQFLLNEPQLTLTRSDIFTCVLFSKKNDSKYEKPDLIGFKDLPDVWVVGYGLDDGGEKRGWIHLYGIPKIEGIPASDADSIFEEDDKAVSTYHKIRYDVVDQLIDIERMKLKRRASENR